VEDHEQMDGNPASDIDIQGEQAVKKHWHDASKCWDHMNNQTNSPYDVQSAKMPAMQLHVYNTNVQVVGVRKASTYEKHHPSMLNFLIQH
jgi:hypothetical protein